MSIFYIIFFLIIPVWLISDMRNNKKENEELLLIGESTETNETIYLDEKQINSVTYFETDEVIKELPISEEIESDVEIEEVDETVYATMNVNIREEYNDESTIIGLLVGGNSIKRTGICSNGWSRVLYGNEEHYIHSEYLTTVKPKVEEIDTDYIFNDSESEWKYLGEFKITSYCGGECCNGKWAGTTSTGVVPKAGRTIAVAPWIIPYGSEVMIEGLDNIYIAEDTGGFANRNDYQIDLFSSSHERAMEWGIQYRKVWIKK